MTRERPDEAQVLEWIDTLSNWGRWGSDDSVGTLNLVTPDVRRRAAASVTAGHTVSCAFLADPNDPRSKGRPAVQRSMLDLGEEAAQRVATLTGSGDGEGARERVAIALDEIHMRSHSELTHLDAPSHVGWDGKLYNGRSVDVITTEGGCTELGTEIARDGIVTRGVLLDVAAARGVPRLDPADDVFPEDLEAAEQRQGVRVESGDAVLLSTGFPAYRYEHPDWTFADGIPGWQAACMPWLYEREVALIAHEGPGDSYPTGYDVVKYPAHVIGIVAMGLWLLDHCNLAPLVDACESLQQWTMLLTVAPLPIVGTTGSPVNPIAVL